MKLPNSYYEGKIEQFSQFLIFANNAEMEIASQAFEFDFQQVAFQVMQ